MGQTGRVVGGGRGAGGCITGPASRRKVPGTGGLYARDGANAQAQEGSRGEGTQGLHAPKSFLTM